MNDFLSLPHVIFSMPPSSHQNHLTVPSMTNLRPSIRCDAISFINSRPSLSEGRIRSSEDRIRTSESNKRTSETYPRCKESHLRPSNSKDFPTDAPTMHSAPRPVACIKSSYTNYIRPVDTASDTGEPGYTTISSTASSPLVNDKSGLACGITRGFRGLSQGCARLRVRWVRVRGRGQGRKHVVRRCRGSGLLLEDEEGKDDVTDEEEAERVFFAYK
ncbi:hypothetical protein BKA58DRAFT_445437 [Alternaria rosae]|uniref:uncharacterized protein n=1 Tax=Alternaria rosae TaxID=1187941 RepID=UPI001E8D4D27|nr:uncharacterized protein BKA58DRAFT_445437 [Alternaria rosae]KAH6881310.1 hypothetical protein BKA58DRAFT_445437 [Alternaria rosae]